MKNNSITAMLERWENYDPDVVKVAWWVRCTKLKNVLLLYFEQRLFDIFGEKCIMKSEICVIKS